MINGQNSEYIFKVQALTATVYYYTMSLYITVPFGETNIQMFNIIPSIIKYVIQNYVRIL